MANAAAVSAKTGKPAETDFLFQSTIAFCEKTFGRGHYLLGSIMGNYAEFLRTTGRHAEAKTASKRAKAILSSFGRKTRSVSRSMPQRSGSRSDGAADLGLGFGFARDSSGKGRTDAGASHSFHLKSCHDSPTETVGSPKEGLLAVRHGL